MRIQHGEKESARKAESMESSARNTNCLTCEKLLLEDATIGEITVCSLDGKQVTGNMYCTDWTQYLFGVGIGKYD